jgi:glycine/D-amino acid oxidase-like deaminating enzyme
MNDTISQVYGDNWYASTRVEAAERPRLTVDLDLDVCVIGGGLAGLTTAREVARLGWSVALLEEKRLAWSASGRNTGFVLPGFACDIRKIIERVGMDRAKVLWTLSEAGVTYVRDAIRELDLPQIQPRRGWLNVSKVDNGDDLLDLVSLLGQEFGADVEGWPTERVRAVLRSDSYFHAIHFPRAFHIHPLNYALGLAAAAEAAGVRIFEDTPALEIDPAGVRKRVVTPSGRVRAAHVVLAGNTHIAKLVPPLGQTVLPVTSYVAVTAPLGPRLGEAIAFPGAVSDTRAAHHHYRIVDGERLMWAGGADAWPRDPRRVAGRFQAAIAQLYPQLGDVEIAYAWSGVTGCAVHRMPQIGEVSPGLWLAGAFGGQGINTTAIAGNLIARAIVEGDDRWRIFFPYELVWAGGALGRTIAQVGSFVRRRREEIAAALARRRERLRRQETEQAEIAVARKAAAEARAGGRVSQKREAAE